MSTRPIKFKPLTPKQRGYLAQLAKQAHTYLTGKGAIDEPFDAWRKQEAMEASGGFTISEAPSRAFDALEQRFLMLAGKTEKALERALGPENDMRQLAHEIGVAQRQAGVTPGYVAGICKRMFDGATTWGNARQAKAVLAALRAKARTDKNKEAAPHA